MENQPSKKLKLKKQHSRKAGLKTFPKNLYVCNDAVFKCLWISAVWRGLTVPSKNSPWLFPNPHEAVVSLWMKRPRFIAGHGVCCECHCQAHIVFCCFLLKAPDCSAVDIYYSLWAFKYISFQKSGQCIYALFTIDRKWLFPNCTFYLCSLLEQQQCHLSSCQLTGTSRGDFSFCQFVFSKKSIWLSINRLAWPVRGIHGMKKVANIIGIFQATANNSFSGEIFISNHFLFQRQAFRECNVCTSKK